MGNHQRVLGRAVLSVSFKMSLASLAVGKKINIENVQMAIAAIQTRGEGGLDKGRSRYGGEQRFD